MQVMRERLLDALAAAKAGGALVDDPPWRPADLAEAYEAAEAFGIRTGVGRPVGWKIGATGPGAQEFLKISEPIRGRIFAGGVCESPAVVAAQSNLEAEPEIIFRLRQDADVGQCRDRKGAEVVIEAVHAGFEINRPRYRDPFDCGVLSIIADNAAHEGLVIGHELDTDDLAGVKVHLYLNGRAAGEGSGAAVMDDPVKALIWLAESLPEDAPFGGALVATGGMCRSVRLSANDLLTARFTPGGEAALTVRAR